MNYVNEAILLSRDSGDRSIEIEALSLKGYIESEIGNDIQAIDSLQSAIELLETFRSDIQVSELASSFITKQVDTYELLFRLLWQEGRYVEAFDVVERIKARGFLDQLANDPLDVFSSADARLLLVPTKFVWIS